MNKSKLNIFPYFLFIIILFLTIGWSSFGNVLTIAGLNASIRIEKEVRITDFKEPQVENDAISNWHEYNVSSVNGSITLPNENSKVTYKVSVTNIGKEDVGIFDISGLNSNLEYTIKEYNLKDKICDQNSKCNSGITKEFYIIIGYKEGCFNKEQITYLFNLKFDFRSFLKITYIGFSDYSMYKEYVIEGGDLNITFEEQINNFTVRKNGVFLENTEYSFDGINFNISNVTENIDLINLDGSTFISGIEFNYLVKNGTYAPEGDVEEYYNVDANRLVDNSVKRIIFGKTEDYLSEVSGIPQEPIDIYRTGMISLYRKVDSDGKYIVYILSNSGKFILNENASWTFDKLYSLEDIVNLHLLDTSNVVKMRDMFCDCASLTNIDLSNFDTSKVTNMTGMFARTHKLKYLDLTSFDTSSVEIFKQMFSDADVLEKIYVSNKWVKPVNLKDDTTMFGGAISLVGGNGTAFSTSKVTSAMAVVDGATQGYLTGKFNFAPGIDVNHAMKSLTQTQIDNWDISTRYDDEKIKTLTFGKTKDYYEKVINYEPVAVDSDKSGVISLYKIPNGSNYDIYILSNSGKFIMNETSNWFFDKLYKLEKINNLDMVDTSEVKLMRDMFCDCEYITELDLSSFDTRNVTSMEGMFARTYYLKTLDLSSFNTNNVTNMLNMFHLSISATETHSSLQNVVPFLQTIYVSNKWTTAKVASGNVFANNVNLVGGRGTIFQIANIGVAYAKVDEVNSPGYLTLK